MSVPLDGTVRAFIVYCLVRGGPKGDHHYRVKARQWNGWTTKGQLETTLTLE